MHDNRLEDELRVELRRAGDALPLTVTAAELERRLMARRRQRQGRRVSLIAAAVAVLAVVSIVAVGNGWIGKPSVVVGVSPSSSATVSPPPSASLSASATPSADASPSVAPIARTPFGRPDDTILISEVASGTPGQLAVTIVHEDMTTATGPVLSEADFPDGTTVSHDHPPRVSATGYLLVLLDDANQDPAGAALYDLHDPTAGPRFYTDPSIKAFGWSPTGLLAADFTTAIVISDPAGPPATPRVVPMPSSTALVTMDANLGDVLGPPPGTRRGLVWTADGLGLVAEEAAGLPIRGVLALDGKFTPGANPATFASTGMERLTDLTGETVGTTCDPVTNGASACHLVSFRADGSVGKNWDPYSSGTPADWIWSADGNALWIFGIEEPAGAKNMTIRIQLGGPTTYKDVATAPGPAIATDEAIDASFAGLTPDDSRIAIDLGTGKTLVVNRLTGKTATFDGTFAGWGDATGFIYPNPEAP
jgi:hypothetical protein